MSLICAASLDQSCESIMEPSGSVFANERTVRPHLIEERAGGPGFRQRDEILILFEACGFLFTRHVYVDADARGNTQGQGRHI